MTITTAIVLAAAYYHWSTNPTSKERASRQRIYSIRSSSWTMIQANPLCDHGWFKRFLRCEKIVYETIVSRVENAWTRVHPWPHWNTIFHIRDRVACCLHFIGHIDGYDCSGVPFGIGHAFFAANS
jgi:hypothetical protein